MQKKGGGFGAIGEVSKAFQLPGERFLWVVQLIESLTLRILYSESDIDPLLAGARPPMPGLLGSRLFNCCSMCVCVCYQFYLSCYMKGCLLRNFPISILSQSDILMVPCRRISVPPINLKFPFKYCYMFCSQQSLGTARPLWEPECCTLLHRHLLRRYGF